MRRLVLAAFAVSMLAGCQPATTEDVNPLEGAWRVSVISFTAPDSSYTITNPQPSLYLFAERHYSMMYVPGNEPRPLDVGDAPILGAIDPTDAEKVASWDTFIANSGTYEVRDSTITFRPMVAKSANLMATGGPLTDTYHIVEDVLHLRFVPPWAPETETRTTLTRIR
jgi:hypothetical protein